MAQDDIIRRILAAHGKLATPAASAPADADLFELGLDSQAAVNVMLALEDAFGFEFPEAQLTRETFATISSIARAVQTADAGV